MADAFDDRLIKIGIQIDGQLTYYENPLFITARGTKYGNFNPNECRVQINNLTKDHRNYILTETSPFNKNRTEKILTVEAGRKSYGTSLLFIGNITTSAVTQPPDIGLVLNALTGYANTGRNVAVNMGSQTPLSVIAERAALDNNLSLNFQAQDKTIENYGFTGGAAQHVEKLSEAGGVDVFVDNNTLIVKDVGQPIQNSVRILNKYTGMIGIPEITERGIRVKMLFDNTTTIGGQLDITSELNPAINGSYVITNLSYEVATREQPFYYIAECLRLNQ